MVRVDAKKINTMSLTYWHRFNCEFCRFARLPAFSNLTVQSATIKKNHFRFDVAVRGTQNEVAHIHTQFFIFLVFILLCLFCLLFRCFRCFCHLATLFFCCAFSFLNLFPVPLFPAPPSPSQQQPWRSSAGPVSWQRCSFSWL